MTVTLAPMPASRLQPWMLAAQTEYIKSRMQAGDTADQARENARASFDRFFAGGVLAENHHVYDVMAESEPVGYVWVGPQVEGDLDAWWVWDIEIDTEHRGSGFGRQAMTLAEAEVRRHGGRTLGLNVFGYNTAARGLYESLGYETTAVQMRKAV